MDTPKRPVGRPRKPLPLPTNYKGGVEWCIAALNDPTITPNVKAMVAATLVRYETARDFGSGAGGKKETRADAAKEAAVGAYEPPPAPPRLAS